MLHCSIIALLSWSYFGTSEGTSVKLQVANMLAESGDSTCR